MTVLKHQTGRSREAVRHLRTAIDAAPREARLHADLGLILHDMRRLEDALEAHDRALALAPDLPPAHNNRGHTLRAMGRFEEALAAFDRCLALDPRHASAANNRGLALKDLGRTDEAIEAFALAIELAPGAADAHNNLGNLLREAGRIDEALASFDAALDRDPGAAVVHNNRGNALAALRDHEQALDAFDRAVSIDPDYAHGHLNRGIALKLMGRYDEAAAAYQRAVHLLPEHAEPCFRLAELAEARNRTDEAETWLEMALAKDPGHAHANRLRATLLRRQGDIAGAINLLGGVDVRKLDQEAAIAMSFELGQLHDRSGSASLAFQHFEEGNRLLATSVSGARTDPQAYLDLVRRARALAEQVPPVKALGTEGPSARSPIFIVGFPRSGTTLLDQVLDAHPALSVVEEQPLIEALALSLGEMPAGYPQGVPRLDEASLQSLRDTYERSLAAHVAPTAGVRIVDKFPLNIVHVHLIARLYPHARYVFALRHPLDVCLSCFMQSFVPNDAMANFTTLHGTAALYDEVMRLWRASSPALDVHTVRYEALVDAFEPEARALVEFLGLEWDDAVLDYARHARSRARINTPSYAQVTEAIYDRARFRWRRYATHLGDIAESLRDHIEHFGYAQPGTPPRSPVPPAG